MKEWFLSGRYKYVVKACVFLLIFAVLLILATHVLAVDTAPSEYRWMTGIYEETAGALDGVYIGSSNCYAYWNSNAAWEEYGIAVRPYCCSYQPLSVAEYMIREARKTQPDAVYIVNINSIDGQKAVESASMHRILDYMPLSANKLQLAQYLCDRSELSFSNRLEYYVPMLKYHTKWNDLSSEAFSVRADTLKGGNTFSWYFERTVDISEKYIRAEGEAPVIGALTDALEGLLDYCDAEKVKVVFVAVPRAEKSEEQVQQIRAVGSYIAGRGYPVLDLLERADEIGLDLTDDFYDEQHTNIHGSIKFTYYIADYLVRTYGLQDKRGEAAYSSWDASSADYFAQAAGYVLPTELDATHRAYDLAEPAGLTAARVDAAVQLTWEAVDTADSYVVFRKADGTWQECARVTACAHTDSTCEEGTAYTYAVVACRTQDGETFYGEHRYNGVAVSG